jgi:DNA-binding beta-propeller fold protein YncE
MRQNSQNPRFMRVWFLLLVALFVAMIGAAPARVTFAATTLYVDPTGNDSNNCLSQSKGACKTIGAAISKAAGGDTIRIAAGTYAENLAISKSLNLVGVNKATTIIDGGGTGRVVLINGTPNVGISSITMRNGQAIGNGGGIINAGTLTLRDSIVRDNAANGSNVAGGGITNNGTLTLQNSSVIGNTTTGQAGGIYNSSGRMLTMSNSSITDNISNGNAGGLRNDGTLTAVTSTISRNQSHGSIGGGIFNVNGTLTLSNTIVSNNTTTAQGGGIFNNGGILNLNNKSIVSGNSIVGIPAQGGGIFNDNNSTLILSNSTVRGNIITSSKDSQGGGIYNGSTITLENSIVSGNTASSGNNSNGGGIYNGSTLILSNSTIFDNTMTSSGTSTGGGVFNNYTGTLTLDRSSINNNTISGATDVQGGGIYSHQGSKLTLNNSTISGNSVSGGSTNQGGGIVLEHGMTTLTNSTVSNNTAAGSNAQGGGIYAGTDSLTLSSSLTLSNTTISGNSASAGGGIYTPGVVTLTNTILAGNKNGALNAPDCAGFGTFMSRGYNLIGNNSNCTFVSAVGDQVGTGGSPISPLLGPLQNNGGPTLTQALLLGSPAIDAGNACPSTDQRGDIGPRPQGARCDIGAYEVGFQVNTLVGTATISGSADGMGAAARFNRPEGVAVNGDGTLALVADTQNHTIRKVVVSTGQVTTLAGSAGSPGPDNGVGSTARFNHPIGVALNISGTLALVADTDNNAIRRIDVFARKVTTITATLRFNHPEGVALSADGKLALVADTGNGMIRKINMETGQVTTLPTTTQFEKPTGIALSADGTLALVTDTMSNTVSKVVVATGEVTTLATLPPQNDAPPCGGGIGVAGSAGRIHSVAVTADGRTGLISSWNHTITRVSVATGLSSAISTIAGQFDNPGHANGIGQMALFDEPSGVTLTRDTSSALIADTCNNTIRYINSVPIRYYLPLVVR